jgi:putative phage-type endonuclease
MENDDWLEFRKGGIGSSDAPIIAGVSPYSTPYQLWEIKTRRKTEWIGNFATRRGHAVEPKARADY